MRRLQLAKRRDPSTLTALGGALRRAPRFEDANAVLSQAIALDPSKTTNTPAYTARGALLRDSGQLPEARALLEECNRLAPSDPCVAAALAAVYLNFAERGHDVLLKRAKRLIGLVYACEPTSREAKSLYRRLDAVKRRHEGS